MSKSGSELIVPTSNQQLISLGRRLGVGNYFSIITKINFHANIRERWRCNQRRCQKRGYSNQQLRMPFLQNHCLIDLFRKKTQNSNILKEHLDEALPKEQKQKYRLLLRQEINILSFLLTGSKH